MIRVNTRDITNTCPIYRDNLALAPRCQVRMYPLSEGQCHRSLRTSAPSLRMKKKSICYLGQYYQNIRRAQHIPSKRRMRLSRFENKESRPSCEDKRHQFIMSKQVRRKDIPMKIKMCIWAVINGRQTITGIRQMWQIYRNTFSNDSGKHLATRRFIVLFVPHQ